MAKKAGQVSPQRSRLVHSPNQIGEDGPSAIQVLLEDSQRHGREIGAAMGLHQVEKYGHGGLDRDGRERQPGQRGERAFMNEEGQRRRQHETKPEHHPVLFDPQQQAARGDHQGAGLQRALLKKDEQLDPAGEVENGEGKIGIPRAKPALADTDRHGNKKEQRAGEQGRGFAPGEPEHAIEREQDGREIKERKNEAHPVLIGRTQAEVTPRFRKRHQERIILMRANLQRILEITGGDDPAVEKSEARFHLPHQQPIPAKSLARLNPEDHSHLEGEDRHQQEAGRPPA
ncbi:MAG: hypothetical protein QM796_03960 [Chthoniobacteraceae bacterium]